VLNIRIDSMVLWIRGEEFKEKTSRRRDFNRWNFERKQHTGSTKWLCRDSQPFRRDRRGHNGRGYEGRLPDGRPYAL
jgi:hypothetical protein